MRQEGLGGWSVRGQSEGGEGASTKKPLGKDVWKPTIVGTSKSLCVHIFFKNLLELPYDSNNIPARHHR